MAKNTLTLNNAPKAKTKVIEDTVDVTEALQQLNTLEAVVNADAAPAAATPPAAVAEVNHATVASGKLAEFRLSPLARTFLDRALVNVSENTGRGLEDEQARKQAQLLGGIIKATGCDLSKAIAVIVSAVPVDQAVGTIYSLCYSVQKACNFIGNMAYRRALDPKSDFDLEQFADTREDHVEPPVGLGPDNAELAFDSETGERLFNVRGGAERKADFEQIYDALEEVHIYLQLVTEAYGWPVTTPEGRDNTMPYCVVMNKDETFSQVHNLEHCLDIQELKYKESRRKKAEQRTANLTAAFTAATAALAKAAAK